MWTSHFAKMISSTRSKLSLIHILRKSVPILEEIRKQLNVTEKKPTTDDMLFTVETVSCLGACGLAPVCTVNDHVYPAMTPEKAREMIREIRRKEGLDA